MVNVPVLVKVCIPRGVPPHPAKASRAMNKPSVSPIRSHFLRFRGRLPLMTSRPNTGKSTVAYKGPVRLSDGINDEL